jgi:mono/diheme cytochrome c family protein
MRIDRGMATQPKYRAQGESQFFSDSAIMRPPVVGTVARGELHDDGAFFSGKDTNGQFVPEAPVKTTMQLLQRGQERFNIYCSPCHGRVGDGQGIMPKYGYVPPPTFHSPRIRELPDGYIFDVITNGIRNMPSYRHQIPVADRWAIISYFRALQRGQNATLEDVPEDRRGSIK